MHTVEILRNGQWIYHSAWARLEFARDKVRTLGDMGIFQGERVGVPARLRPEPTK